MTLDRAASLRVRSHLGFRAKSALQPKGYGPVVGQRHLHVGAEHAGLDAPVLGAGGAYQSIEQVPSEGGRRSGGESGTQAFVRLGGPGELRNQQKLAPGLREAQVHFAGLVRKYAVSKHPVEQAKGGRLVIGGTHSHQNQQSGADRGHPIAADGDAGFHDALQQRDQTAFLPTAAPKKP